MDINKRILEIFHEFKIDKDAGILVLLGIYYKLDVEKVCPEETIKAIAITKIVEVSYKTKSFKWNVPLFIGQETQWDWVIDNYNRLWDKSGRKDANSDVLKRMQEWFSKYPQYRKQDVKIATEAYFKTIKDKQYLKSSAKFIFDGIGTMKKSMLLSWCEKEVGESNSTNQIGNLVK